MKINLKKLERKDFENLFEFEKENKEFFEKFVPPRDEKYFDYQTFIVRNELLLKSQEQHKDYFFIIRNEKNQITGRINLTDIGHKEKIAYVGYRVGERFLGMGIATRAVNKLVYSAEKLGINQLLAQTTTHNYASQKVLMKAGFTLIDRPTEYVTLNGEKLKFVYFKKENCRLLV